MKNLLLSVENSIWTFGITELIALISALLTFAAICTSLYLAQKSKTLKFKVVGKIINKKPFKEHQYQQIEILNNGYIKFTCKMIGYYIDKKYYSVKFTQGLKKLDETIIEQKVHSKNHITTESIILPTYLHEGDMLQLGIWPADFNFTTTKKNCKVYIFIIINDKIYKKYTGMKYCEFLENVKDFSKKSLHNQGLKNNLEGNNIFDDYLR